MVLRQSRYEVRLYDTAGVLQRVITDWEALTYHVAVNQPGTYSLTLADYDPTVAPLLTLDALVEVWRRPPGIAAYADFGGFHRSIQRTTDAAGAQLMTTQGVGYLDLIDRRVVAYRAGTIQAEKRGDAGSVILDYVDENAGPSATVANDREVDGVTAGLAIGADAGLGSQWEGARAWQGLLGVIQGISAQVTDVEFDLTRTSGAAFSFDVVTQIGTDRSASVVFARNLGNMAEPTYLDARTAEKDRAIVLGPGEEQDRLVVVVNDTTLQDDSPWNVTEMTRQATQESTITGMTNVGARALEETKAWREFAFKPLETDVSRYGVDYFLGDTVTARYDASTEVVLRIIGVTVTVAKGLETIAFDVRTVR